MNISITLILYKSEKCITRQKVFNNEENQFFNTLRAKWKEQNTKEKNPEIKWHFLLPKKTNPPNPKTTVKSKKDNKNGCFSKRSLWSDMPTYDICRCHICRLCRSQMDCATIYARNILGTFSYYCLQWCGSSDNFTNLEIPNLQFF